MNIHLSLQQLQSFIHISEDRLELCTQMKGSDGTQSYLIIILIIIFCKLL